MLLFWILAGLISSGAALLILLRAARTGGGAAPADPTLEVYQRQLAEIEELAERGLLGPDERQAARAEAGRRLLGEAEQAPERATGLSPRATRGLVLAAAVAAPLLALGAYLAIGKPGLPDMPYQKRLKSWELVSRTDLSRLGLPETAAVLANAAKQNPNNPQPFYLLGVVERAEGDGASAVRHLQRSLQLDPRNAKAWATLAETLEEQAQGADDAGAIEAFHRSLELDPNSARVWSALGAALVARAQGQVDAGAAQAFRRSLELDPTDIQARYFLARADIAAGRTDAGLAGWRKLAASLPDQDPRRGQLQAQIDSVAKTGKLGAPAPQAEAAAPAQGGEQAAFIQSMVQGLAARLKAQPNDPQGWARLIRSYGVLHDDAKRAAAIAEARRLFKDRPADLRTTLEGEAAAPASPVPPG